VHDFLRDLMGQGVKGATFVLPGHVLDHRKLIPKLFACYMEMPQPVYS
jgi:hypothetical protein